MAKVKATSHQVIEYLQNKLACASDAQRFNANGGNLSIEECNDIQGILNSDGSYRVIDAAKLCIVGEQLRLNVDVTGRDTCRDTASFVIH